MNIDINKSVRLEENNVERTSQTFNYAHKEDEELQNMIEKTTNVKFIINGRNHKAFCDHVYGIYSCKSRTYEVIGE